MRSVRTLSELRFREHLGGGEGERMGQAGKCLLLKQHSGCSAVAYDWL